MSETVHVVGQDLTALAAIATLRKHNQPCRWFICNQAQRGLVPHLMIDESTLQLLKDLFPGVELTPSHTLKQRYVTGRKQQRLMADASATRHTMSVNSSILNHQLTNWLHQHGICPEPVSFVDLTKTHIHSGWQLITHRRAANHFFHHQKQRVYYRSGGKRQFWFTRVTLSPDADASSMQLEYLPSGSLLLIPHNHQVATLFWCGYQESVITELITSSKAIAPAINAYGQGTPISMAASICDKLTGMHPFEPVEFNATSLRHSLPGCWIMAGNAASNTDLHACFSSESALNAGIHSADTMMKALHAPSAEQLKLVLQRYDQEKQSDFSRYIAGLHQTYEEIQNNGDCNEENNGGKNDFWLREARAIANFYQRLTGLPGKQQRVADAANDSFTTKSA